MSKRFKLPTLIRWKRLDVMNNHFFVHQMLKGIWYIGKERELRKGAKGRLKKAQKSASMSGQGKENSNISFIITFNLMLIPQISDSAIETLKLFILG